MNNGKSKIMNYLQQPEAEKRVTTLLKSGNLKIVSGKTAYGVNVKRNRIITISLALLLILIGVISLLF